MLLIITVVFIAVFTITLFFGYKDEVHSQKNELIYSGALLVEIALFLIISHYVGGVVFQLQ